MIYLYDYKQTFEKIGKFPSLDHLSLTSAEGHKIQDIYNTYLYKNSIFDHPINWEGTKIINFSKLKGFSEDFFLEKKTYFAKNSSLLDQKIQTNYFQNIISGYQSSIPELYELCHILVKLLVLNPLVEYINSTLDDRLGLTFINYKDHYNDQDFTELLFHQIVHMTVFIDDIVSPHMVPGKKQALIETPLKYVLGGYHFPIYLAFHSYMVGVEVLLFREKTKTLDFISNYHGSTERGQKIVRAMFTSLHQNRDLFTSRGFQILCESYETLKMKNLI